MNKGVDDGFETEPPDPTISRTAAARYILKHAQAMLMMVERVPELEGLLENLAVLVQEATREAAAADEYSA